MGLFDLFGKKKTPAPAQRPAAKAPQPEPREINVERNYDGAFLKYQYTDIPIKLKKEADISNIISRPVVFRLSDEGKLRVYVAGDRVGRVEHPTVVSVATQWLSEGWIYKAFITSVDEDERKVLLGVFFYKNEYSPRLSAKPDAPEFRLLGGKNADMRLVRLDCRVGDKCEFDAEGGRYAVYLGQHKIGYMPAKAGKLIQEMDEACDVYISNVEKTPDGREIDVRIF